MRKDNGQSWKNDQSNTQSVNAFGVGLVGLGLLERSFDHQGVGAGNGAWKITGSNVRPVLQVQSSKVLGGVAAVSESSWSRCCPSGNLSEIATDVQGVSSIDVFDSAKSNLVSENRIDNNQPVLSKIQVGDDVVAEDQSQNQKNNCCTFSTGLGFGKEESLNQGESSHDDCEDRDQVTRGGSFHPVIFARKERING